VFDIGFTELLLCLVVALVVIGPEQLPGTVRTVALWIGRLKRSLAETRTEIERQIGADDIRRQLHNEEILRNIEETRLQIEASIREHTERAEQESAAAEQARSAADYGPPEELPDHSHGSDHDSANQATTDNNANASKPAAPATQVTNSAAPVATATHNNNQQHPTPAATTPAATPAAVAQVPAEPKTGSGQQAV
jgi:sec-independent protein translocase protein TatB